jgi:hypothetical protein
LVDKDGLPLDPLERAEEKMARRVAECLFGVPDDEKIRILRETILGEDSAPPKPLRGLTEWLP